MTPRKTAAQISAAIIAQLETSLGQSIPLLPKSFIRVLAKVFGGTHVLLYQYCGWILLQMFVRHASNEQVTINGVTFKPLTLWGDLVGIAQKTGQRAEREIEITVLEQGGTLTSGTRFVNPTTEMIYVLIGDVDLDAETVTADIRATETGELGNVDVDEELQFMSPLASVEKTVTVKTETKDGVDEEDTEVFRERIKERYAARPQGGAYADYRDWAEDVEGVRNAYPYSGWYDIDIPGGAAGQVFIYIESEADEDGIPDPLTNDGRPAEEDEGLLVDVFNAIEANESGLASRRNINAFVRVFPISRTTFDLTISQPSGDDSEAAQVAIEAGLEDYFADAEPYITGVSIPPKKDIISTMIAGGVAARIASANGCYLTSFSMSVEGVETELYMLQEGEKAKVTVSWI